MLNVVNIDFLVDEMLFKYFEECLNLIKKSIY